MKKFAVNKKILILFLFSIALMSCKSEGKKTNENSITEKYWKLTILNGKEVIMEDNQKREIFITLKNKDNRFTGFSGCNTIGGEYFLEEGNRVNFSKVITTNMFCDNSENETQFLQALNSADNYTIRNNVLSLNVGRRAPLAVFEAVYMN